MRFNHTRALGATALFALGLGLAYPASAADLGGNCCADLEERVAELEATTARKGNRKVSVTVYGQVNKAVVWHDLDVPSGIAKQTWGDGSVSPTAFGFMGEAKINAQLKAGFKLEFGVDETASTLLLQQAITVRESNVWIESGMGRLTLGLAPTATDGIAEIALSNTQVVAKMLNLEPVSSHFLTIPILGPLNLPFDGSRREVLRYDSPSMGGIIVSASVGQGDRIGPIGLIGDSANAQVWDVAIRYAGEFGGFRVAAGLGYRHEDNNVLGPLTVRDSVLVGSGSVKHVGTGLFANAAYGRVNDEFGPGGPDLTGYHLQGGWEKNVTGLGGTTFFGEWMQVKIEGVSQSLDMYGAGVVQAVDAAALDLYANWRRYEVDSFEVNVFTGGVRIRF